MDTHVGYFRGYFAYYYFFVENQNFDNYFQLEVDSFGYFDDNCCGLEFHMLSQGRILSNFDFRLVMVYQLVAGWACFEAFQAL